MRLGLLAAVLIALWAAAPAAAAPACLGAESRDDVGVCFNPKLKRLVTPTPEEAPLVSNYPCADAPGNLATCVYGVERDDAAEEVALIGDSHAAHWRPALQYAAQRFDWYVTELSRSFCAFTAATPLTKPGSYASHCPDFNARVVDWLEQHRKVHTIFVSALAQGKVVVPPNLTPLQLRVYGYVVQWAKLPPSVTRIIVLRDVPRDKVSTIECVRDAIADRRAAGTACRVRRSYALKPDPQAIAVELTQRSAAVLDFTRQFCSARWCFPVVGGVLVHRDRDHIGNLFAMTLGPIFVRRVLPLLGYQLPGG